MNHAENKDMFGLNNKTDQLNLIDIYGIQPPLMQNAQSFQVYAKHSPR